MNNKSIWLDVGRKNNFLKLKKDLVVDVLVVGGGITGISTIYHLINSNLKVCLVEKNKIGEGVTSRTTGKLTYLQENIYSKLKKIHGEAISKFYFRSQKDAIGLVCDIILKRKIDCDLEKVDSYVFTKDENEKLLEEIELLKKWNVDLKLTNVFPNGEDVLNAYYVSDTYVFHPIKYIDELANICNLNGIDIYEDTKVLSIDKDGDWYICKTDDNIIKAKYVVMGVHYPYFLFPFLMPFKAYLEKSYIEAFKVIKNFKFSAINISKPIISTRYHESNKGIYQLYLTNSHNYCIKNNEERNFSELLREKDVTPDYIWSNKDIITNDLLPYVGRLNDSNLLIGTGYNTWGMTNGSLAGKILADIVLGKENDYITLFNPHRKLNLGSFVNFPIALFSSAYSFIKTKISKQKSWYSDNVKFETRNGKAVGIYVDELGKEHVVYNLCPHMKCSLIFNEIEKTWDCPCHGSRFDIDGKSIEGPSNYNIGFKE